MPTCFTVVGNITSNTRKFVKDVGALALGHFIFELEKNGNTSRWFRNNSDLLKKKIFTDTTF